MLLLTLLFSLCSFADDTLKKGEKVIVYTNFGTTSTGWIASVYSNCLVISDRNGRKGLDVGLIVQLKTEQKLYSTSEISSLLIRSAATEVSLPSEKSVFWGGIANAGIPFWTFGEKKEALVLGGFDLLLLGGGIGTAVYKQNLSIPIFIGLGGLKIWSAVDGASRIRKATNHSDRDLCVSIPK